MTFGDPQRPRTVGSQGQGQLGGAFGQVQSQKQWAGGQVPGQGQGRDQTRGQGRLRGTRGRWDGTVFEVELAMVWTTT